MVDLKISSYFVYEPDNSGKVVERVRRWIDDTPEDIFTYELGQAGEQDRLEITGDLLRTHFFKEHPDHIFPSQKSFFSISVGLDKLQREDGKKRLTEFIDLSRIIYHATTPLYGFGMLSYRLESITVELPPPISDDTLTENRIDYPTWMMLFSPEMVKEYGREWLEGLPAEHINPLNDGGLQIITTTDLTGKQDIYAHLEEIEETDMKKIEEAFESKI